MRSREPLLPFRGLRPAGARHGGDIQFRIRMRFGGGGRSFAQHDHGEDGEPDRHDRRDRGAELHPLNEGLAGGLQDRRTEPVGQLPGDGNGAAEGVAGDRRRLGDA